MAQQEFFWEYPGQVSATRTSGTLTDSGLTLAINTLGEFAGRIFYPRRDIIIKGMGMYCVTDTAVGGTAAFQIRNVEVSTPSTAGDILAILGGGSPVEIDVTASLATATWVQADFDNTGSLTKGIPYWCGMQSTEAPSSGTWTMRYAHDPDWGRDASNLYRGMNKFGTNLLAPTSTDNVGAVYLYDENDEPIVMPHNQPFNDGYTKPIWDSADDPLRRGIAFQIPWKSKLHSVSMFGDFDQDMIFELYTTDGTTTTRVAEVLADSQTRNTASLGFDTFSFPLPTVEADTEYKLVMVPQTTTARGYYQTCDVPSVAVRQQCMPDFYEVTTNTAPDGSAQILESAWTQKTLELVRGFNLTFSLMSDDVAGAGGAQIRRLLMAQGM